MINQTNNLEGGGYELLNVGATISPQLWGGAALDLALTNALDEEYYYFFGGRTAGTTASPGVPRQFRATLRARF
jgi:outer membrane receptor protein involved in Fe transport